MVVKDFNDFYQWFTGGDNLFGGAAFTFLLIALGCGIIGLLAGYVITAFRHGPFESFYLTANVFFQAIPDFLRISPRRVLAIARLAVKEAFRRKVVLSAVAIFAVALLFGGWFLNTGTDHPERTYIGIVSWGTQLLLLMMGLLISSFSLPEDIKNKTIHTVVTKPVRATEILLGRILGFTALLTVTLALMATVCLAFVWRGLSHTHLIAGPQQTLAAFEDVDPVTGLSADGRRVAENTVKTAWTTDVHGHKHRLQLVKEILAPGTPIPQEANIVDWDEQPDQTIVYRVIVDSEGGHAHRAFVRGRGADAEITIGPSIGFFRARVPIYAMNLSFTNRQGEIDNPINVGDLWTYRGYVDGGASLAKAMFDFEGIWPSRFGDRDTIDLEMTLGIYRSYKGTIGKRILASVAFESLPGPDDETTRRLQTDPYVFESVEYDVLNLSIPRKQVCRVLDENGNVVATNQTADFFDDLARNGRIRVIIRCEERDQYVGVGRADVYFRASERPYWLNFFRGFLGTWLQLVIVVTLGVCLSTFLATPVTMLATVVVIVIGFNADFLRGLLLPSAEGGGPIESFVRMITQMNMQTPLAAGPLRSAMEFADQIMLMMLNALTYIVPDFSRLDFSNYVQYGYWIDSDRLLVATCLSLSFCFGLYVFGYFNLKTREIAG